MQQQHFYTAEQLGYLIDNIELGHNTEHLQKLADRKMIRQSNSQYKLQDDIIREQYQQSHQYQEKILNTYRLLQAFNNPKISQLLFEQFDDEYLVIQNTADQCIEWYYRTDNKEYFKVIFDLSNLQNDFYEALQKKIVKDIKANHAKVYIVIKHLTDILEDSFLISIYQNLILNYSFCYLYDFQNYNNTINSIYELTDSKIQIVESQYMESIYEYRTLVFQELFNLDKEQLKNCLLYSKVYLTPKLQFNLMFQERINKDFNVQQINIQDNLRQEIILSLQYIPKNILVEQFIGTIILNYKDLVKYIIDLYLDKLIQEQNSKFLQCLLNLISNPELKSLYYQNNKKKPLMRETLNMCVEERFQNSLNNQELIKQTVKCIYDLYKNGLMARPQLLIYIKQLIKQLCNQHANKQINIKENKIFSSLIDLSNVIESSNKVKDHEIISLERVLKIIINQYKFNWFDIDNLITFESLSLIVKLINMYDENN
ncbi:unnamed protein product [Paramecium pentaurelia]|uniref:Uncharacterized protein n=1 Tax=Paramecium pentaurelia TaxID=43138 RepID=A0A8S1UQJ0_9CILI|nr:unnamed protein product [Paramecium pentaurelia]